MKKTNLMSFDELLNCISELNEAITNAQNTDALAKKEIDECNDPNRKKKLKNIMKDYDLSPATDTLLKMRLEAIVAIEKDYRKEAETMRKASKATSIDDFFYNYKI